MSDASGKWGVWSLLGEQVVPAAMVLYVGASSHHSQRVGTYCVGSSYVGQRVARVGSVSQVRQFSGGGYHKLGK